MNAIIKTCLAASFFPPSQIYIGAGRLVPADNREKLGQAYQILESKGLIKKLYQKWFPEPVNLKKQGIRNR
jgi:ABC-type amino acid transport substrate-binding protein